MEVDRVRLQLGVKRAKIGVQNSQTFSICISNISHNGSRELFSVFDTFVCNYDNQGYLIKLTYCSVVPRMLLLYSELRSGVLGVSGVLRLRLVKGISSFRTTSFSSLGRIFSSFFGTTFSSFSGLPSAMTSNSFVPRLVSDSVKLCIIPQFHFIIVDFKTAQEN